MLNAPPPHPPSLHVSPRANRGKSVFQKDSGAKKEVVLFEAPPPPHSSKRKEDAHFALSQSFWSGEKKGQRVESSFV